MVIIQLLRSNMSTLLQAALSFRKLAICGLISASATVVATTTLVLTYGGIGALIGLVLGELVLTTALVVTLRRDVFLQSSANPAAG